MPIPTIYNGREVDPNQTWSYGYGGIAPGQATPFGTRGSGGAFGQGQQADSGANSAARQYLTGTVAGQNTPYNQATRDNMYSQQTNMSGAAEAARNNQIAEQSAAGGASPSDPSYQRLIRQSMAQRQSQNQQSMGDIDRTANLANQQTQQQAANTLLGSEDNRYALAQGYNQRATQMALGYLGGGGHSTPSNYGSFSTSPGSYSWPN